MRLRTNVLPVLMPALVALAVACSGTTTRQVASVSVVGLGSALTVIHGEHQAAYQRATDALRERLRADGGTLADYDREAAPLTAAFRLRSAVIASLSSDLYSAATVIDATRGGGSLPVIARTLLESLDRTLGVLRDGSVLAPVDVPASVQGIVTTLRALLGDAPMDGGI